MLLRRLHAMSKFGDLTKDVVIMETRRALSGRSGLFWLMTVEGLVIKRYG